ncbi:hypothetical protein E4H12_04155 [Candidatus Thorarchaeota archaeon]|nr:MAG: hypothetical protein E4H12_04155 [Candidatus Thorarchaeota archaeon]
MKVTDIQRLKEARRPVAPSRPMREPNPAHEAYRDARQQIRTAINELNSILGKYFDMGERYDNPDQDTLQRLGKAASMVENATHVLAAGTPHDKPDPMDV